MARRTVKVEGLEEAIKNTRKVGRVPRSSPMQAIFDQAGRIVSREVSIEAPRSVITQYPRTVLVRGRKFRLKRPLKEVVQESAPTARQFQGRGLAGKVVWIDFADSPQSFFVTFGSSRGVQPDRFFRRGVKKAMPSVRKIFRADVPKLFELAARKANK